MTKRKGISKKVRFEVFKRDSFTCQYCGQAAPSVVLHIDHIEPVSKGGDNEILNLITSCESCNAGKSDRRLDDQSTLAKQRQQIAELSERREQLEMMVSWRNGLKSIKDSELDAVAQHWSSLLDGQFSVNPVGLQALKKLLRKFGAQSLMDGMSVAAENYAKPDTDGRFSLDSVSLAFSKIGGVCALSSLSEDRRRLYYIRAIVRNRMNYCNDAIALRQLEEALELGVDLDELQEVAKQARNWTQWQDWMNSLCSGVKF